MPGKLINTAILSPSQNPYSETFIQAHKNFLKGNLFYYYGNVEDLQLEGKGSVKKSGKGILFKLKRKILSKPYSWFYEQFLIESFSKNNIQVVLAEYGPTAQRFLSVLRFLKLPLIVHFHGYDASIHEVVKNNNNYQEIFNYADFVIVVSKRMYMELLELGCPENKLVYNVYGPNDEFLRVQPSFSKSQFIAVGRFVDKKAPYYLILAFKEVTKKFPEARLVIAGDGPLWDTCKNLVNSFGLKENVELPGVISPDRFKEYLSQSLAFVQHSITAENGDSEGTPLAILEASAAGLPVIATNHAGIPDVIVDRETGLLVEEHDYFEMANKMKLFLHNSEYAEKLGRNGKERVRSSFTLERHIAVLNYLILKAAN